MLVSWIHPFVCNNLVFSSWSFSCNPLIIVVACLYVYIHQTPLALWTWFWKQVQKAWYLPIRQGGGSESYSYSVLPVFCGRESQRSSAVSAVCSLCEDASSIFCLTWSLKVTLVLQTVTNLTYSSKYYGCICAILLQLFKTAGTQVFRVF